MRHKIATETRRPASLQGLVRRLVVASPEITTSEIFAQIKGEFPRDNPKWLMNTITIYKNQTRRKLRTPND